MRWGITTTELVVAGGAFVASTLITTAIVVGFLVSIRPNYFIAEQKGLAERIPSPLARNLYLAGKNLLGAVLVVVGVVLSLPGVPGQGLLTILVGVVLLDVPGKRRFELAVVRRPRVLNAINRLRTRFNRQALIVEDAPEDGASGEGTVGSVEGRTATPGGEPARHEDMADS